MASARLSGTAAIDKGLALFVTVLQAEGASLSALADRTQMPHSTAQRIVGAFLRQGLLSRIGRGHYGPGLRLADFAAAGDRRAVLAAASRPVLAPLARSLRTTVHLGVLEGDMVTYLVKEHGGGKSLRTREADQLEAYCSAIGKILLAALDDPARELYLAAAPFVRLTPHTMTDPAALRAALRLAGDRGYAEDRAEFEDGLYCLAVPVRGPGGGVVAALSASGDVDHCDDPHWRRQLRTGAARIGQRLGAATPSNRPEQPDTP